MERSRPDQILDAWASVAAKAVRPAASPRRNAVRSNLPGLSLAGGALLVAAVLVAAVWIGRPGSDDGIGAVPTVAPTPSATAEPTPSATPAPSASDSPVPSETPSPTPSPTPTLAPEDAYGTCAITDLDASITMWEGAAGSRIATIAMTYAGSERCRIPTTSALRLIDSTGAILIEAAADPDISESTAVDAGYRFTTLVRTSNYCGADPTAPVTIAFVSPEGGTVIASPFSPTDATVPPCNGPGQPAAIEMQPWTR